MENMQENDLQEDNKQEPDKHERKHLKSGQASGFLMGVLASVSVFVIAAFILVSTGYIRTGGIAGAGSSGEGIGSDVEDKLNALDIVLDNFYFDDVDTDKAAENIYKAYLNSFGDVYTTYYTPEEYKAIMESVTGKFFGIGAVCQKAENGSILVVDSYEDSPADKAGIKSGDYITKVDGKDITSMNLNAAVALIKGEKGTYVELEVVSGNEVKNVKVKRDEIKIKTVEYELLEGNMGYIYVTEFDSVTLKQFNDALDDLKSQGMESLIIDVRSNPGGELDTVVKMLDSILPDGLIVYTQDKQGNQKRYEGDDGRELDIPLAVLVNGASASASEIFAGAIQDYDKGVLIGTQTFGKGIVQTIKLLPDGSAVKFTIAKYFTPDGQDIHGNGLTPDIVVEIPKDAESDLQLEAAIKYLKEKAQ